MKDEYTEHDGDKKKVKRLKEERGADEKSAGDEEGFVRG